MKKIAATVAGALAAALVGLAGPASAATGAAAWQAGEPSFTAPAATTSVVGVNYQPMWSSMTEAARSSVLGALADAGTSWVRIDVAWGTIQPANAQTFSAEGVAKVDQRIREIRAHGMQVLLMFYWAPKWSSGTEAKNGRPGNPADFARAAAWVAERYDGTTAPDLKIDAMELWNEPDLDTFWAPSPQRTLVSDFAALIKAAGPAVKAANPGLTVVVGGTTNVGTSWYSEFYKTPGIVGTYDALGIHPYQSPSDAAPSAYDAKYGEFYMKHIPALDKLMTANNDPATIWATEFGWSTHASPAGAPNWKRGVSEQEQAQYLLDGFSVLAQSPRLEAAFWYNAQNTSEGDAQFDNYGLLNRDFSKKPAYYAYKCAASGVCGTQTAAAEATGSTESAAPAAAPALKLQAKVRRAGAGRVIVKAHLKTKAQVSLAGQKIQACVVGKARCTAGRTNSGGQTKMRMPRVRGSQKITVKHVASNNPASPVTVSS